MMANNVTEILARCVNCDFIGYESIVEAHLKNNECSQRRAVPVSNYDDHSYAGGEGVEYEAIIWDTEQITETEGVPIILHTEQTTEMEGVPGASKNDNKTWTDSMIKYLIQLYKKHQPDFASPKKTNRSVWQKIALELQKQGYHFQWEQVETKFKNMKKTYKKIVDNKKSTGTGAIRWPYYDIMHEIFCKNPEIQPIEVLTTFSDDESNAAGAEATPRSALTVNQRSCVIKRSPKRKRSMTAEAPVWFTEFTRDCQKRHEERLAQQDRLINAIEKLAENS